MINKLKCAVGIHDYWCDGGNYCSMGYAEGCCIMCKRRRTTFLDELRWKLWGRFDLRYEWIKLRERLVMKFVWALPREIIRWAVVRATAHATTGQWGMDHPGRVTAFEVMDRWEQER